MFREAMRDRFGEAALAERYRAFDTICSATQDRQDAVIRLLAEEPLDLMVVIGGYNSSNTCNLAHICAEHVPTYHIADPACLVSADDDSPQAGRRARRDRDRSGWLPPAGPLRVGLTSGASTPDNLVERVVRTLDALRQPRLSLACALVVRLLAGLALALAPLATAVARAATALPDPASVLGFEPCADYKLATYEAIDALLPRARRGVRSDDARRDRHGRSKGVRCGWPSSPRRATSRASSAIATSPRRWPSAGATAAPLTDDEARALAARGTRGRLGGLRPALDRGRRTRRRRRCLPGAWCRARPTEIRRIRDDVILLLMPNMNPDGTTHGGQLVHAARRHAVREGAAARAVPPLRRARQQPRLVHVHAAGVAGRRAPALSRLVSADRLQPAPGGAVPRAHLRAAVRGSGQPATSRRWSCAASTRSATRSRGGSSRKARSARSRACSSTPGGTAACAPRRTSTTWSASSPRPRTPRPRRPPTIRPPSRGPSRPGVSTSEPSIVLPVALSRRPLDAARQLRVHAHRLDGGARRRRSRRREEWLYDIYQMGRDQIRAGAARDLRRARRRSGIRRRRSRMVNTLRRGGVEVEQATDGVRRRRPAVRGRHVRDSRRAAISRLPARSAAAAALSRPAAVSRAARPTGRTTSPAGRCRCRWACASTRSPSPSPCRPGRS